MFVTRLQLTNWRNFPEVDIPLQDRIYLVGPNASGKSNLLDVFRFLRDIAKTKGGGLQTAVEDRGGLSKIRCLSARRNPYVQIEAHLGELNTEVPGWRYILGLSQKGKQQPKVEFEKVFKDDVCILERPDNDDRNDPDRLSQTHLEQINANAQFRDIADYFSSVLYFHLVPQLLRFPDAFSGPGVEGDPFGRSFLERVASTPTKTRESRLKRIEKALQVAAPQLKELVFVKDNAGRPHLEARYEHWRPNAGKQREDQFSDGTLRLLGLLWSIMESDTMLLLEEPELSLNSAVVARIPQLIRNVTKKKKKRQVLMSTHDFELLSDKSINADEVVLLTPHTEGNKAEVISTKKDIRLLLESGLSVADVVIPKAAPSLEKLSLLDYV